MARKILEILTDDLEGGDAQRTVVFSFDGTDYEIDLNDTNIGSLTAALEPFINAARKTSRSRARKAPASTSDNPKDVRAWARAQGTEVSDRGRVPIEIIKAYQQRK